MGAQLAGVNLRHPFYERLAPVLIADYVTLDAGTGAVHTAPAHGLDDFATVPQGGPADGQPARHRRALS